MLLNVACRLMELHDDNWLLLYDDVGSGLVRVHEGGFKQFPLDDLPDKQSLFGALSITPSKDHAALCFSLATPFQTERTYLVVEQEVGRTEILYEWRIVECGKDGIYRSVKPLQYINPQEICGLMANLIERNYKPLAFQCEVLKDYLPLFRRESN